MNLTISPVNYVGQASRIRFGSSQPVEKFITPQNAVPADIIRMGKEHEPIVDKWVAKGNKEIYDYDVMGYYAKIGSLEKAIDAGTQKIQNIITNAHVRTQNKNPMYPCMIRLNEFEMYDISKITSSIFDHYLGQLEPNKTSVSAQKFRNLICMINNLNINIQYGRNYISQIEKFIKSLS